MTQIQTEVARLQTMADDLAAANPDNKDANHMAEKIVPGIETLRAQGRKELDEGSMSTETYNAISAAMGSGEDSAWSLYNDTHGSKEKEIARQFDNIHIMMNAIEGLPVPRSHKCWPPGSEC